MSDQDPKNPNDGSHSQDAKRSRGRRRRRHSHHQSPNEGGEESVQSLTPETAEAMVESQVAVSQPEENETARHDHEEDHEQHDEGHEEQAAPRESGEPNILNVRMSDSLLRRLKQKAQQEGVSVDDFCCELLAEGLVLRAWEIMERKSTMRGGNQQQGNHQNNNNNNQRHGNRFRGNDGGGGGKPQRRGGLTQGQYKNIMEDKASFLEYVRNQERNRR